MAKRFNPPPNWPAPPEGWQPQPGWTPDPSWPPPPPGWELWVPNHSSRLRTSVRALGPAKLWALVAIVVALLFLPAGPGGSIFVLGCVVLVVGVVGLLRGHTWWGWVASRRMGSLAVVAGLFLWVAGGSLMPAPKPVAATSTPSPPLVTSSTPQQSANASPSTEPDESAPTSTAPVPVAALMAPKAVPGAACRSGNPLANVYHPSRLEVVSACSTVSGTVRSVHHEDDGDLHVALAVDPAYAGMLSLGNISYQHGLLVVEVVPADEPGCTVGQPPRSPVGTYDYGTCTGDDLSAPQVGAHIWVTGPYVLDHIHDWAEIHPAWQISSNAPAPKPTVAAAPSPSSTTARKVATPVPASAPAPRPAPAPAPRPAPAPTPRPAPLSCSASVSNASPSDYSTVDVFVQTAAGAQVQATANYRTTSTTHSSAAGSDGSADIPFRISRATPGYTVTVDVQVSLGSASASCSTSFTPQ